MKKPTSKGWTWTTGWRWPWTAAADRMGARLEASRDELRTELAETREQVSRASVALRATDGRHAEALAGIEKRVEIIEELVALLWAEADKVPEEETEVFFARLKAMLQHGDGIKAARERLRARRG